MKQFHRGLAVLLLLALLLSMLPLVFAVESRQESCFQPKAGARILYVLNGAPGERLLSTLRLAAKQFAAAGMPSATVMEVVGGNSYTARAGDILVCAESGHGEEGYRLEVTPQNATVYYSNLLGSHLNGLLYGLNALLKNLMLHGGSISCGIVQDAPDTRERTLMLDCARKYWSVQWIKNLIAEMSWMGFNALELHLTEDQGIHANIWKDVAGNTVKDCNGNDFSWLPGYRAAKWVSDSGNGQGIHSGVEDPNGGKNYHRDELIEICKTAKEYHIEIIPSVDLPGHTDYLIDRWSSAAKNFEFEYNGVKYAEIPDEIHLEDSNLYSSGYKMYGTLNITNDYARKLSLALTQAYAEFFQTYAGSRKFNIGCDEIRGKLDDSIFVSYVNDLCAMLKRCGYAVRAFNDYLYRNSAVALDQDLEICYWKNSDNASVTDYFNDKRRVYNCLNNYCYYVLRYNQSSGDARSESNTFWSFHHSTADRIYAEWNPSRTYPYNANAPTHTDVSGGYFLIWGDWGGWNTEEQVWNGIDTAGTYNLIDRMWSSAAKMWQWNLNETLTFDAFCERIAKLRYFPGYNACTSELSLPATVTVQLQTIIGTGEQVFDAVIVGCDSKGAFRAVLPELEGYRLYYSDSGRVKSGLPGLTPTTLNGVINRQEAQITVHYFNVPNAKLLQLLSSQTTSNYDHKILEQVKRFCDSISSVTTDQRQINMQIYRLLCSRK